MEGASGAARLTGGAPCGAVAARRPAGVASGGEGWKSGGEAGAGQARPALLADAHAVAADGEPTVPYIHGIFGVGVIAYIHGMFGAGVSAYIQGILATTAYIHGIFGTGVIAGPP